MGSVPAECSSGLAVLPADPGELTEAPYWDVDAQRLLWVDIPQRLVHEFDTRTAAHGALDTGHSVSAFAPLKSGGWVAAVERGFLLFDETWTALGPVIAAPDQAAETRFNDGHCDPWGNFWAGTMVTGSADPGGGALYRFGLNGEVTAVLSGVTESNGIGWSPDGRTMYYVDSGARTLDAFVVDPPTGLPLSRKTLVRLTAREGVPDGLAVDAEGCIWVALWDGASVCRFSPRGRLLGRVLLPVSRPTSVAFGGPDLRDLYITTASEGLDPTEIAAQPLAGSIFHLHVSVPGLRPIPFGK